MTEPSEPVKSQPEVASLERVILEAKRQDDLREAEAKRVNGLFERLEANLASEVRQIRELLTLSTQAVATANSRAELVAKDLAERVDNYGKALQTQMTDLGNSVAEQMATQQKSTDERLLPLESAVSRNRGRDDLANGAIKLFVGAALAVAGALAEHMFIR